MNNQDSTNLNLQSLYDLFGGYQNFQAQFQSFSQTIQQNPQQLVQNMLNDGRMTQEDFNRIRPIANALTVKHY